MAVADGRPRSRPTEAEHLVWAVREAGWVGGKGDWSPGSLVFAKSLPCARPRAGLQDAALT